MIKQETEDAYIYGDASGGQIVRKHPKSLMEELFGEKMEIIDLIKHEDAKYFLGFRMQGKGVKLTLPELIRLRDKITDYIDGPEQLENK